MRKIILASTSPRRKALLALTGLPFTVEESGYEEDMTLPLPPQELVKKLSRGKAETAAKRHKNAIVIGADTFVVLGRELLGKPHTAAAARSMLRKISGKTVSLLTGITVIDAKAGKRVTKVVESKVYLKKLTPKEIRSYVRSGEPLDKAGAFAVEGLGAVLIKKIEGGFPSMTSLPLHTLSEMLKQFGIFIL